LTVPPAFRGAGAPSKSSILLALLIAVAGRLIGGAKPAPGTMGGVPELAVLWGPPISAGLALLAGVPRPDGGPLEAERGGATILGIETLLDMRGGAPALGMTVAVGGRGAPVELILRLGPVALGGGGVALALAVALPGSFLFTHFFRSGS